MNYDDFCKGICFCELRLSKNTQNKIHQMYTLKKGYQKKKYEEKYNSSLKLERNNIKKFRKSIDDD